MFKFFSSLACLVRRSLATTAATALIATAGMATADFDVEVNEDWLDSGIIVVALDESHDACFVYEDDGQLEFEVLMFDPQELDDIPAFSQMEDLASDDEDFDYDLDEIEYIVIRCGGGNDLIYTDGSLSISMEVSGQDGDDVIYGGNAGDILLGGDGKDQLFGGDGKDRLFGGDGPDILDGGDDGWRDTLTGGGQNDVYHQYYRNRVVVPTLTKLSGREALARASQPIRRKSELFQVERVYQDTLQGVEAIDTVHEYVTQQ